MSTSASFPPASPEAIDDLPERLSPEDALDVLTLMRDWTQRRLDEAYDGLLSDAKRWLRKRGTTVG